MRATATFALRLSTLFAAALLLTAATPAAVQGKGAPNRVPQHPSSAPGPLKPGNLETRGAFIGAPTDGQGIKRKQPATRPRASSNPGSSMPALEKHETKGSYTGTPVDGQGIKRKQPSTRPRADANPGSSMPALEKHETKGSYSGTPADGQGIRRKQPRKGGRGHANGPGSHPSH
jgi:hypothetical protein